MFKRIAIVIWLAFIGTNCFGAGGGQNVGGGDSYSQEFFRQANEVIERLEITPIAGVNREDFRKVASQVQISSQPALTLGGRQVDALNYPDPAHPRIVISRAGWDRLKEDRAGRDFLVFHEFLGLLGIDDSNYRVSLQLDKAEVCQRSRLIKDQLEQRTHLSCDRILFQDLQQVTELYLDNMTDISDLDLKFLYSLKSLSLFLVGSGDISTGKGSLLPVELLDDQKKELTTLKLSLAGFRIPKGMLQGFESLESVTLSKVPTMAALPADIFTELFSTSKALKYIGVGKKGAYTDSPNFFEIKKGGFPREIWWDVDLYLEGFQVSDLFPWIDLALALKSREIVRITLWKADLVPPSFLRELTRFSPKHELLVRLVEPSLDSDQKQIFIQAGCKNLGYDFGFHFACDNSN